jgi:glucose-1-phosphate cytidylyltransferase
MKVVIFCGGLGMRLREYSENVPKPMVPIGYRPVLWHVMKYYAHFGHRDFILCLGYRADAVKDYFLKYDECLTNDFTLSQGGKRLKLFHSDIHDWNITFADTGVNANIGMRLKAVEKYLQGEEMFLANYSDGLTNMYLPRLIETFQQQNKIGGFVSVCPSLSYHLVSVDGDGLVQEIREISRSNLRINGGYFIFRKEVFQYIREGEELVHEPFQRLIERKELVAHPYDGFFASMDTFKDKQMLDDLYNTGKAPWAVWKVDGGKNEKGSPTIVQGPVEKGR